MLLIVMYEKQTWRLRPGETFTFGRALASTAVLPAGDRGLSRRAGSFRFDAGSWWVHNDSSSSLLFLSGDLGFRVDLPPGMRAPLQQWHVKVLLHGFLEDYTLRLRLPHFDDMPDAGGAAGEASGAAGDAGNATGEATGAAGAGEAADGAAVPGAAAASTATASTAAADGAANTASVDRAARAAGADGPAGSGSYAGAGSASGPGGAAKPSGTAGTAGTAGPDGTAGTGGTAGQDGTAGSGAAGPGGAARTAEPAARPERRRPRAESIVTSTHHRLSLTDGDRLVLAARFEEYLSWRHVGAPAPLSATRTAERIGWQPHAVSKRCENIRNRFTGIGVPGLRGPRALEELVRLLMSTGTLTADDLRLLPPKPSPD